MTELTRKRYVIDTNVVLLDPDAIFKFDEHEVIIPITVVEEADNKKKAEGEVGRNARKFSRNLAELVDKYGDLNSPQYVNNKYGTIRIAINHLGTTDIGSQFCRLPLDYDNGHGAMDNRILNTANYLNATLVTCDNNLRIKALAYGVKAEEYKNHKVEKDDLYDGISEFYVTDSELDTLYDNGFMNYDPKYHNKEVYPNQCFLVKSIDNPKHSALVTYNSNMKEYRVIPQDLKTMDILPRNSEQQLALTLLRDPNIKAMTLTGKAGSGKGLCSLAAALKAVLEDKLYEKILIARPIVSLNNAHKLGFMPGDEKEKLSPWLKPFYENINYILSNYNKVVKPQKPAGKRKKDLEAYANEMEKEQGRVSPIEELIAWGVVELCSLETVKGRTLHNTFVLITEAQNCTLADIKTIVTRIGEGSKIVIEGDRFQIDHPYLDITNNGLTHVAEKLKGQDFFAHIELKKSERSKVAEVASDLL